MALNELVPIRGVVLLGAGKMGGALLKGWLGGGMAGKAVEAIEPQPSDETRALCASSGVSLVPTRTRNAAAAVVIAVKPQILDAAVQAVAPLAGPQTVVVSIAAGRRLASLEAIFGTETPIVRAMPNTPASIGAGISALIANAAAEADPGRRALAEALMAAAGETLWLETEAQMDAVTGVSGSGPAYVFHLVEALAQAAQREGLPEPLAMKLARETVAGAGKLLAADPTPPSQLRENVTSPNGTTAAGLAELMAETNGLTQLMTRTVAAAARRSRELGDG